MKVQSSKSPESRESAKCGNVAWLRIVSSWLYHWLRSNLAKILAPFKSEMTSLIVGVICCSLWTAWLAWRMSTHMQILPGCFGFGAATTADTQGVSPSTFHITPFSSSPSSWLSDCLCTWKGMRWCCWATSCTVSPIMKFHSESFQLSYCKYVAVLIYQLGDLLSFAKAWGWSGNRDHLRV